jgi:hypothetical protein
MALEHSPTPLLFTSYPPHFAFSPSIYGLQHLEYSEHMTTLTAPVNLENQLYNVYRFILSLPIQDRKPSSSKPIRSRRNRKLNNKVKAD